jgi:PAS domain S-box-containing protein
MADKPTYEELKQRVKELEKEATELKRTEEVLMKSEERFRIIFNNAPQGIVLADHSGRFLKVNSAWENMFGYNEEESQQLTIQDITSPEDIKISTEKLADLFNGDIGRYRFEKRFKRKDGSIFWGDLSVSLMHNLENGLEIALGVVVDITDRKRFEEALRDSEERYKTIFKTVPTSIVFIDKEGKIVDINSYHVNHIGKGQTRKQSYVGKNIITHPSIVQARLSNTYKKLLEGEAFEKTDVYFPTLTGGADGYFNVRGVPLIKGDEVIGAITTHEDITERKRSVNALRESEGKLNAMLQSIGDHMSMVDKDLNIIWANRMAREMFGNDIIGKKCYEVYHQRKEPCEPYPCITLKAFQDGKVHKHDTQVIDKDGKTISFLCTANVALRDKEGKPTAVLEISRDTTEHKQAELDLIERSKELEKKTYELEEVNAALRVLLKHREEDKKDLEDKVVANVKKLVFPYVEKLNNSRLNDRQMVYLNIIKSNLEDIITPFLHQLSSKYSDLTPNEIQVAGFVKEGKTTKEIAELLNSSTGAINFHRNNLRKKLGLRNTKTNLRSFLLSLA